jgi:hypothetical protein
MQNFLDCAYCPLSRRIIVCPPTLHSSLLGPKILPLGQQTEVQAANANANARRRLPQFAKTVWGKGYSVLNLPLFVFRATRNGLIRYPRAPIRNSKYIQPVIVALAKPTLQRLLREKAGALSHRQIRVSISFERGQ